MEPQPVEREAAEPVGQVPSVSASGAASASGFAKSHGPHSSTATGASATPSTENPGSRSERGAARSRPSSPYVQAWYGH